MKNRLYYILLFELLIVLILTTTWEFWLEDITFGVINVSHAEEDLTETLEGLLPMCANCKMGEVPGIVALT